MINKIEINFISHNKQRYPTVGDWQIKGSKLKINVSNTSDFRMNSLIAIHELIESLSCYFNNISSESVDNYDVNNLDTAGSANFDDNTDSPYFVQHNDALALEWIMSRFLGVDWKKYSEIINNL